MAMDTIIILPSSTPIHFIIRDTLQRVVIVEIICIRGMEVSTVPSGFLGGMGMRYGSSRDRMVDRAEAELTETVEEIVTCMRFFPMEIVLSPTGFFAEKIERSEKQQ